MPTILAFCRSDQTVRKLLACEHKIIHLELCQDQMSAEDLVQDILYVSSKYWGILVDTAFIKRRAVWFTQHVLQFPIHIALAGPAVELERLAGSLPVRKIGITRFETEFRAWLRDPCQISGSNSQGDVLSGTG